MKALVTLALLSAPAAAAPFDELFKPGTHVLHCTGDAIGEVTCTIDRVARHGGVRTSRMTCTNTLGDSIAGDPEDGFATAIFEGTDRGVWRAPAGAAIDRKQPAWLASPPAVSHWQEDREPHQYSGMQHFTLAHGSDWCAAWWPWGRGGAPTAWAICVSPSGALTGIAAAKTESRLSTIRCGDTPAPESLLPAHLQP